MYVGSTSVYYVPYDLKHNFLGWLRYSVQDCPEGKYPRIYIALIIIEINAKYTFRRESFCGYAIVWGLTYVSKVLTYVGPWLTYSRSVQHMLVEFQHMLVRV